MRKISEFADRHELGITYAVTILNAVGFSDLSMPDPAPFAELVTAAMFWQMEADCRAMCQRCANGHAALSPESAYPYWGHACFVSEGGVTIPAEPCQADAMRRAWTEGLVDR